jgi:replication factor A1
MRVVLWGKNDSEIPKVVPAGTKARLIGVKAKMNQQELEIHGNESTTLDIQTEKQVEPMVVRILSATTNENGQRMILGVDKQKQL